MQPDAFRSPISPKSSATLEREEVILVDELDREIGTAEKLAAHQNGGALHRAFSIFIFDHEGRMLIQRRAAGKYHFPLLWTNACCSHPRPGEKVEEAAHRRLFEELGADAEIFHAFEFVYQAKDEVSGLTEREFDHVFVGKLLSAPDPRAEEIDAIDWRQPDALMADVLAAPEGFTPWFRMALTELADRGFHSAT